MVRGILERIIEKCVEQSTIKYYLQQSMEEIVDLVHCLTETSIGMEFISVEQKDFIGNTFGENIGLEPPRMKSDNWIRGKVKMVKGKSI